MKIHLFTKVGQVFLLLAFAWFLALMACAPRAAQAPETKFLEKSEVPDIKAKISWEQQWENLIKEAKKEGKVYIRTARDAEVRQAIAKAFKDKFGIEVESETGKGAESIPKTLAERGRGLFIVDVYEGGATSFVGILKAQNLIEPLDNLVFNPEVLDKNLWLGSNYGPFFDKDHMIAGTSGNISPPILINTRLVNIDEITSFNDLLHPKWKGKILMGDPTVSGGQQTTALSIMELMGEDFLIKLVEQQKPTFTRDRAQIVDWVAKEKYPLAIGATGDMMSRYMDSGANVVPITPIEGAKTTVATALALMKDAPHPRAAQLFMNWILSREGQSIFYRASGFASRRVDVSNEWVYPEFRMQPGVKYLIEDEEAVIKGKEQTNRLIKLMIPYVK